MAGNTAIHGCPLDSCSNFGAKKERSGPDYGPDLHCKWLNLLLLPAGGLARIVRPMAVAALHRAVFLAATLCAVLGAHLGCVAAAAILGAVLLAAVLHAVLGAHLGAVAVAALLVAPFAAVLTPDAASLPMGQIAPAGWGAWANARAAKTKINDKKLTMRFMESPDDERRIQI